MERTIEDDLAGRRVGRYAIVGLVATGGHGRVYRGRDERLLRDVAIKVLAPRRRGAAAGRRDLITEAQTLSRLNHPHVAGVYDFVRTARREFLVMEFVPGATLRELLASGPLPVREVARLGAQIARGLAAAHAARVVHRDIKPSNLKVTSSGDVKILDFGVAVLMPETVGFDDARTPSSGTVGGTVPYMAPEQIRADPPDERGDIFSAGAVLYEMAAGVPAFPQRNLAALVHAVQYADPPALSVVNPDVPPALERIIVKAMRKEPAARQQNAIELAEALEALVPRLPRELRSDGKRRLLAGVA